MIAVPHPIGTMKIVFWNIKRNKNMQHVVDLVDHAKPDIFFLAECPEELELELTLKYQTLQDRACKNPKIHGFKISEKLQCELLQEFKNRLFLWRVKESDIEILLGVVHLISMNNNTQAAQALEATIYAQQIRAVENLSKQEYIANRRF